MMTPSDPIRLETTKVLRNGRRRYDPASKERLVEACLEPGVSLAGMALRCGVNANLLRKWVAKRQLRDGTMQSSVLAKPSASAFIPVIAASRAAPRSDGGAVAPHHAEGSLPTRLKALMPNGVTLTLEGGDAQLLSAMIEALGRCDVPAGG